MTKQICAYELTNKDILHYQRTSVVQKQQKYHIRRCEMARQVSKMTDDFTLLTLRNSRSGQKKPYRCEIVVRRFRLRPVLPTKEASSVLVQ